MSRNGSGTYSLPAGNPVVTGTTIASTWANNTLSDIASALTDSVAADGQTPMTGNLDLNSNKIVNVTDPTLAQDAATKNYVDTADGLALLKANNLSDVVSASTSRTNLGLGSIATQNSNNVSITGGSISGASLNANDISSGTLGKARLPTGSVLQVVSATNSTQTSITGSTYTDTSLTASITPTSSSSKILILVYQPYRFTDAANGAGIIILRNSTALTTVVADATGPYPLYLDVAADFYGVFSANYLDSPATTSSTTYKTQARPYVSAGSVVLQLNGNNANTMSTITLMEIAA